MWNFLFGGKGSGESDGGGTPRNVRGDGAHLGAIAPAELVAKVAKHASEAGLDLDPWQSQVLDHLGGASVLPQGIYLYGDVGRGKSWMADLLFSQLPEPKRRLHCHEFLADINAAIARRMRAFAQAGAGKSDPDEAGPSTIDLINSVVDGYPAIMLDDFHVHDVADGELLHLVLKTLQERHTFMLLTSNYAPQELMPSTLFHETFLPAIALIEEICDVVQIASGPDHRLEASHESGFSSGTWTTVSRAAHVGAAGSNLGAASGSGPGSEPKPSRSKRLSFAELCEKPYSATDYFTLLKDIDGLTLTAVPEPADIGQEPFQRFAFLIDALVDGDVRMDVESVATRQAFNDAANLPRDSDRMLSRLSLLHSASENGDGLDDSERQPPQKSTHNNNGEH